jgi:NADH:ubiquinone oxidoreductase subunit 4 (subunit M)
MKYESRIKLIESFIQNDMKCLVAYSSIVHIGILLRGIERFGGTGAKQK